MILVAVLLAYLLGSIPFGLIVAKNVRNIDIREYGSKNIGATNVFRVLGKKWGILVFVLDALKGYLAVILPLKFGWSWDAPYNILYAVSAILGHTFPVWLQFKGGKGVATSFGVFLAASFLPCILAFLIFCTIFGITHILSAGSLCAAVAFPWKRRPWLKTLRRTY